jgi:hypothetical protein
MSKIKVNTVQAFTGSLTTVDNDLLVTGMLYATASFASTASAAPNYTLTASFTEFTSSYYQDSSSFENRIDDLEQFSSSLDATFATDAELNQATASLSSSISSLSSSFGIFSGSYNTGSFTGNFSGSFSGSGADLFNIPASSIVGLNLSQISSGSVSASISPDSGLEVNTNITATSFTGSLLGTASYAEIANLLDGYDSTYFANTGSNQFKDTQYITGALALYPSENFQLGDIDTSYLYVTTSADNTEYNLHFKNNGVEWETHWLEEKTETGLVWGGVVSFSGPTIFITPGAGLIVNHNANTASHGDTVPTYVPFNSITASATFITSSQLTYLLIDTDGSLIQQTAPFTPQQFNEKFPLGYITHLATSSIDSFADARTTTYGQNEQQGQFIRSFGPLKTNGYDIIPQTGSLKFTVSSGRTFRYGGFYKQNPDNPSTYDSSTVPTGSIVRLYKDPVAIGGFKALLDTGGIPFTDIDPTKWDDGSGTLQSVLSTEWTIQRAYQGVVTNITYIYYGQNVYDSLNSAIQGINTEPFEESSATQISLPFIGYIIVKGDTTDLGDTVDRKSTRLNSVT